MSFVTGTANFPNNYDLSPTGSSAPTLIYVLDEIRDVNGVIIQSGNTVKARDINVGYTVIDSIEKTLGINPEGAYGNVASRLDFIETSGNGAFVHITGDTITGHIVFSTGITVGSVTSSNLNWLASGNSNISALGNITVSTTGNSNLNVGNLFMTGSSAVFNVNSFVVNGQTYFNQNVYNEVLGGTANGTNKNFTFAHSPINAMVFVSGSLILPTTQYVISGSTLKLTGTMYAPTTPPVAGFYNY